MSDFVGYIGSDGSVFEGGFTSEGAVGPIGPQGPQGETGPQGPQGEQGIQGIQGIQGVQGPAGADGQDGQDGQDGYTPVKGVDYFTAADIAGIEADILAQIPPSFDVEVVASLPTQDISTTTIYLVAKTGSTGDVYNEYLYVNNNWELIGSTEVDLTSYYTKTETDTLLSGKQGNLIAGLNITISGNKISSTNTTYTAGTNVTINANNEISATDTTYSTFAGTDGSTAGTSGLGPAPATTDDGKFLCADGTWQTAGSGSNITYGTTDLTPRSITT